MIDVREASLVDIPALAPLFHAYRQLSVSLAVTASEIDSKNWLTACINNNQAIFLIATKHDQLLGFATLYKGFSSISLNHYWTLNDLYVIEQARGLGVGSTLLGAVDRYALASNAKGVELETALTNRSAQKLYEQLGYRENSQYKRYFKSASLCKQ